MKLKLKHLKRFDVLNKAYRLGLDSNKDLFLVGGIVRDCILNRPLEHLDFDITVSKGCLGFARKLADRLKSPFVLLNEPEGVARIIYKYGCQQVFLDFSDMRAKNIKEDLGKRDFTLNALAIGLEDVLTKKDPFKFLIDPTGGLKDIGSKRIRLINEDNLKEDPLRLLRAFSLSARTGFSITGPTLTAVKKYAPLITNASGERQREELCKILSTAHSAEFIKLLDKSGLLLKMIPEFLPMHKLKQDNYHHLDVFGHTLSAVKELEAELEMSFKRQSKVNKFLKEEISSGHSRLCLLKLAALLHDIGKPATFSFKDKRVHFYGHERLGAGIASDISDRLRFSSKEKRFLKVVISNHLRPGFLSDNYPPSKRALFRYFRDTSTEAVSVAIFSLSDQRATKGVLNKRKDKFAHEKLIRFLIKRFFLMITDKKKERIIDGFILMKELKLSPGLLVGELLNEINEAQAEGSIKDKGQAIQWAKSYLKKTNRDKKWILSTKK